MPTGYTAVITENPALSLRDFALRCSRAFGAMIAMRDDPMDAPIPQEFKAGTYYAESAAADRLRLAELLAMTEEQISDAAKREYIKAMEAHSSLLNRKDNERAAYTQMLLKVEAWTPPTPDHEGLKQFMIDQINQSIDFDCSTDYMKEPVRLSPPAWHEQQVSLLRESIARRDQMQAEEDARTASRNTWLQALVGSLPVEGEAVQP